jgi:hypothetical protein
MKFWYIYFIIFNIFLWISMFLFWFSVCNCAVHKKCHGKILGNCPGSAKDSRETKVDVAIFCFILYHYRLVNSLSVYLSSQLTHILLSAHDFTSVASADQDPWSVVFVIQTVLILTISLKIIHSFVYIVRWTLLFKISSILRVNVSFV